MSDQIYYEMDVGVYYDLSGRRTPGPKGLAARSQDREIAQLKADVKALQEAANGTTR